MIPRKKKGVDPIDLRQQSPQWGFHDRRPNDIRRVRDAGRTIVQQPRVQLHFSNRRDAAASLGKNSRHYVTPEQPRRRPHSSQQPANSEAKSSKGDANDTLLDRRNGSGVFENALDESSPIPKKMESDAPSGDKNASGAASEEGCWQARRRGWYSSSTRSMTYLVRCKW